VYYNVDDYDSDKRMKNVQRKMEPSVSGRTPKSKELIKALPDMIRICPDHGNEITEGCCDAAIEGVPELLQLIDRAKKRYKEKLAPLLEPHHTGEMVGIDLETGDYFVGEDEVAAADKARAAGHEGLLYFLRIGFPYTHRLMTPHR